jgi:hypothetical protein
VSPGRLRHSSRAHMYTLSTVMCMFFSTTSAFRSERPPAHLNLGLAIAHDPILTIPRRAIHFGRVACFDRATAVDTLPWSARGAMFAATRSVNACVALRKRPTSLGAQNRARFVHTR